MVPHDLSGAQLVNGSPDYCLFLFPSVIVAFLLELYSIKEHMQWSILVSWSVLSLLTHSQRQTGSTLNSFFSCLCHLISNQSFVIWVFFRIHLAFLSRIAEIMAYTLLWNRGGTFCQTMTSACFFYFLRPEGHPNSWTHQTPIPMHLIGFFRGQ